MSADSQYANVVLALPLQGINGGTVFTDLSRNPKVITPTSATTVTVNHKFGTSAARFFGNSNFLSSPTSSDFNLLGGDLTVEFWCANTVVGDGVSSCFCLGNSSSNLVQLLVRADGLNLNSNNGTSRNLSSALTLDTNWHHVAWTRASGTDRLFYDGNLMTTSGSGPVSLTSYQLWIGANYSSGTSSYNGYMQDVRITKGYARYTANFTPPTTSFAGVISGFVQDSTGAYVARTVNCTATAGNTLVQTTTSTAGTGAFSFNVYNTPQDVVGVDSTGSYNDVMASEVLPALYS